MSATTRDAIVARAREALASARLPLADMDHPGRYVSPERVLDGGDALVASFRRELEQLGGQVHPASPEAALDTLVAVAGRYAPGKAVAWDERWIGAPGTLRALAAAGLAVVPQQVPESGPERESRLAELEQCGVGITGADFGLAETGSLVLTSGPGRGRLASLLPIAHIAVLPVTRLVWSLADVFGGASGLPPPGSNLVVITGPSRTADIEMSLTRGVHGPRDVHVIVVG